MNNTIGKKQSSSQIASSKLATRTQKNSSSSMQTSPTDAFDAPSSNRWPRMVRGRKSDHDHQAIQDILGNMCDDHSVSAEHLVPQVPNLEKDIFSQTGSDQIDMAPIVSRYAALEETIQIHLHENDQALSTDNLSQLTMPEIISLREYKSELIDALAICRHELDKARLHEQWQIEKKDAAAREEEQF